MPVLTVSEAPESPGAWYPAAKGSIDRLVEAGILRRVDLVRPALQGVRMLSVDEDPADKLYERPM